MNTVVISSHRRYFPRGPGFGLKALTLILCSAVLIIADSRGITLKPAREWATWALSPVVWLVSLPSHAATATDTLTTRAALEAQNKDLHDKQLVLEAQLSKFQALEAENRRIRELLSSAKSLSERVLIAEIVAINQDPYRHQITLNKGTRDGVYRGQALVDATGILGQIIEVGPGTSQALLITDPDHGIPVEINRTGLQTIALGRGDGQGLTLPFLPSNADVKPGDLLVSSSLGGRFPSGYPVGQIYDVKHTAGEHFMAAVAYPSARLNQGRQALLVWSTDAGAMAEAAAAAPSVAAPAAAPATAAPAPSAAVAHKKKT